MQAIDVNEQQDVDEFFLKLMDKLEERIAACSHRHLFKNMFSGVLTNQLICKVRWRGLLYLPAPMSLTWLVCMCMQGCPHSSERLEECVVVSLEVKRRNSVEEALQSYVKGEMLDGDNQYMCGTCNKKRDTLKRLCIRDLPNTLLLHLKVCVVCVCLCNYHPLASLTTSTTAALRV